MRFQDRDWTLSGNHPATTNNQMELQAAVAALGLLLGTIGPCTVDLYTDSEYLRQGVTDWLKHWLANGWRTRDGSRVKNRELWLSLQELIKSHTVTWHWIKGHAGHPSNERADWLATRAREARHQHKKVTGQSAEPRTSYSAARHLPEVAISVKASYSSSQRMGGWGVVLRKGNRTRTASEQDEELSANALLIRGATRGLKLLNQPCKVTITSDADYLIRGASQWISSWLAREWHTKTGKPVANQQEWRALLAAMELHEVTWKLGSPGDMPDLALAAELASKASGS